MCLRSREDYYGVVTRSFHWIMAFAIFGMLGVGLYMVDLPNNPDKFQLYGLHKSVGAALLLLVVLRISWRFMDITPELPERMKKGARAAAHLSHSALYALMFLMPLSGWLMSSAAGFPVSFFGLFTLPDMVSPDKGLQEVFASLHAISANILMILIVLHAFAALLHHFYHKDDILRRMLPGRRSGV